MTHTTETLANYLGKFASAVLAEAPFKNWPFEKSFEDDLEEPLIDYIFAQNGVDFVCSRDDRLSTIFLYSDESRTFDGNLEDIPLSCTRQEIVDRLGAPAKSGGRTSDPILGEYGAWDRFDRPGYAVHIEYHLDTEVIKKITLMRADVVP